MFCRHCGREIKDNSEFCRYCGKRVGREQKSFPQGLGTEEIRSDAMNTETSTPSTFESVDTAAGYAKVSAAVGTGFIVKIAAVVLAVAVAAGGGVWAYSRAQESTDKQEVAQEQRKSASEKAKSSKLSLLGKDGYALLDENYYEEAAEYFEKRMKKDPEEAYLGLIETEIRQHHYGKAKELAHEAADKCPTSEKISEKYQMLEENRRILDSNGKIRRTDLSFDTYYVYFDYIGDKLAYVTSIDKEGAVLDALDYTSTIGHEVDYIRYSYGGQSAGELDFLVFYKNERTKNEAIAYVKEDGTPDVYLTRIRDSETLSRRFDWDENNDLQRFYLEGFTDDQGNSYELQSISRPVDYGRLEKINITKKLDSGRVYTYYDLSGQLINSYISSDFIGTDEEKEKIIASIPQTINADKYLSDVYNGFDRNAAIPTSPEHVGFTYDLPKGVELIHPDNRVFRELSRNAEFKESDLLTKGTADGIELSEGYNYPSIQALAHRIQEKTGSGLLKVVEEGKLLSDDLSVIIETDDREQYAITYSRYLKAAYAEQVTDERMIREDRMRVLALWSALYLADPTDMQINEGLIDPLYLLLSEENHNKTIFATATNLKQPRWRTEHSYHYDSEDRLDSITIDNKRMTDDKSSSVVTSESDVIKIQYDEKGFVKSIEKDGTQMAFTVDFSKYPYRDEVTVKKMTDGHTTGELENDPQDAVVAYYSLDSTNRIEHFNASASVGESVMDLSYYMEHNNNDYSDEYSISRVLREKDDRKNSKDYVARYSHAGEAIEGVDVFYKVDLNRDPKGARPIKKINYYLENGSDSTGIIPGVNQWLIDEEVQWLYLGKAPEEVLRMTDEELQRNKIRELSIGVYINNSQYGSLSSGVETFVEPVTLKDCEPLAYLCVAPWNSSSGFQEIELVSFARNSNGLIDTICVKDDGILIEYKVSFNEKGHVILYGEYNQGDQQYAKRIVVTDKGFPLSHEFYRGGKLSYQILYFYRKTRNLLTSSRYFRMGKNLDLYGTSYITFDAKNRKTMEIWEPTSLAGNVRRYYKDEYWQDGAMNSLNESQTFAYDDLMEIKEEIEAGTNGALVPEGFSDPDQWEREDPKGVEEMTNKAQVERRILDREIEEAEDYFMFHD